MLGRTTIYINVDAIELDDDDHNHQDESKSDEVEQIFYSMEQDQMTLQGGNRDDIDCVSSHDNDSLISYAERMLARQ